MNRGILITLGLVVLLGAVAGVWLTAPEAAESAPFVCPSGAPRYATAQGWASGSSCSEAESALHQQLLPQAQGHCGSAFSVCNQQLDVEDCYPIGGGQYNADGVLRYSCRECDPPEK